MHASTPPICTHTQQRKRNLLPGIIAVHYAAFAPDSFLITAQRPLFLIVCSRQSGQPDENIALYVYERASALSKCNYNSKIA